MRKTIVTALVTLLVMLAVVSCDSGLTNFGAEKAKNTANESGYVTLKVNTSRVAGPSKSLTGTFAQEDWDYVEVIFRKERGTTGVYDYHRANGYKGQTFSIRVPVAIYADTEAIALIGKKSGTAPSFNYTLLAIGKLSVPSLNLTGSSAPSSITFNATPLTANLAADALSPALEINETGWTTPWASGDSKKGKDDSQPSFQVPTGKTISASLIIGGFDDYLKIYVEANEPKITFTRYSGTAGSITQSSGTQDAAPDTGTQKINFTFDSPSDEGRYKITFTIPVQFTDENDTNLGWVIKGGTKTGIADSSGTTKGEGILLLVSDDPFTADTADLDINISGL